jgi:hypothetical protein
VKRIKKRERNVIRVPASEGDIATIEMLLRDPCIDPSINSNEALICAAQNGHAAVVDRLLQDERVDPSAEDNDAIRIAAGSGHIAVVNRLLQDDRVDPCALDNTAIGVAADCGRLAVVERLLQDARVDPSSDNNYAIRIAAESGYRYGRWQGSDHVAIVDRLLQDKRVYSMRVDVDAEHIFRIRMIRSRCAEICVALQDLGLPALLTLGILDQLIPNTIRMAAKWDLVVAVKHFHDRRRQQC